MTTKVELSIDGFVLDTGSTGNVFKATMNRYRPSTSHRQPQDPGYILLFAHGTGFHKEIWEPTLEHLFENDKRKKGATPILEAWAIDCQNHGKAAPLNDDVLFKNPELLTIHDYADAFARLYRSGLLGELTKGVQKIVLVGHSAGSVGVIYATTLFGSPAASPFDVMILVDPPIFSPEMSNNMTEMYRLVEKTTPFRRSIWNSKQEAHEWLKTRVPWKFWDPRVLKLYAEHSLRALPTPFQPNGKGVVLNCSPAHEATAFSHAPTTLGAVEHLGKMCSVIPLHLVFGARNDMFSREVQDSIHDPSVGRVVASVTRVKGAGHLVVQERPDRLADALYAVLNPLAPVATPKL